MDNGDELRAIAELEQVEDQSNVQPTHRPPSERAAWALVIITAVLVLVTAVFNYLTLHETRTQDVAIRAQQDATLKETQTQDAAIRSQQAAEIGIERTPAMTLSCDLIEPIQKPTLPPEFFLFETKVDKNGVPKGTASSIADFRTHPTWTNAASVPMHRPRRFLLCALRNVGRLSIALINPELFGSWSNKRETRRLGFNPAPIRYEYLGGMPSGDTVTFAIGNIDTAGFILHPRMSAVVPVVIPGLPVTSARITPANLFGEALLDENQELESNKELGYAP